MVASDEAAQAPLLSGPCAGGAECSAEQDAWHRRRLLEGGNMHPTSSWQGPEEGAPRAVKDDLSPRRVPNWIDGAERPPSSEQWFDKLSPVTGRIISQAARSNEVDVSVAVA